MCTNCNRICWWIRESTLYPSLLITGPFPSSHAGQIHQREQEIAELKQKIAEVMAVMPSLSYSSDGSNLSPVTPHYSSKFMDNSPSSLDPNASVYQPLKKWLWHPHCCQTEHCLFHWSSLFQVWVFFELNSPLKVFYTQKYHTSKHPVHTIPPYIRVFGSGLSSI